MTYLSKTQLSTSTLIPLVVMVLLFRGQYVCFIPYFLQLNLE